MTLMQREKRCIREAVPLLPCSLLIQILLYLTHPIPIHSHNMQVSLLAQLIIASGESIHSNDCAEQ